MIMIHKLAVEDEPIFFPTMTVHSSVRKVLENVDSLGHAKVGIMYLCSPLIACFRLYAQVDRCACILERVIGLTIFALDAGVYKQGFEDGGVLDDDCHRLVSRAAEV